MEYPNLTALSKGRVEIQGSETWLRIRKEAKEALAEVERLQSLLAPQLRPDLWEVLSLFALGDDLSTIAANFDVELGPIADALDVLSAEAGCIKAEQRKQAAEAAEAGGAGLERFVGKYVTTTEPIPSDRRGETIPAGTPLLVLEIVGDQHFNLVWPGGRRAANQVHYSKLMTN